MRPLAILQCVAKAALKNAGNLVGFGLGDVVEQVWKDWEKEKTEAARKAELEALVQMAAGEFRQQVEAIVRVEPTVLVFGRGKHCNPQFPREKHERVSRHHCLVEINPPDARIRELGSLQGTYVNGQLLPGKRPAGTKPGANPVPSSEMDL